MFSGLPWRGAPRAAGAPASGAGDADPNRIKLSWLLHLHWGAILGQTAAILAVAASDLVELPIGALLALVALEVAVTIGLGAWLRRAPAVTESIIAWTMIFDAVVLTVMLAFSGAFSNPFSILYLVNVALAAVLLRPLWAWLLLAVSLALFGSLFALDAVRHHGFALSHLEEVEIVRLHTRGLWVALAIGAAFIVYIVSRVRRELAARDQELAAERGLSMQKDKVASLATLAAGAAHELSTPLATIAVVTRELERSIGSDSPPGCREDLSLIRQQLGRCQDILQQMAGQAGEHVGEPLVSLTLSDWARAALDGLPGAERVVVRGAEDVGASVVEGPARALARTLRSLLKNGLQATPGGQPVELRLHTAGSEVQVEVVDAGRGMAAEVLARAGEPFFTTKSPGEGMGLGLFLTRALAEQLGGSLELESAPGKGTVARLRLPAALVWRSGGVT